MGYTTKCTIHAVDTVEIKKKGQLIKVPKRCDGIALIDDQIAAGGRGKIYIISKTGELKKTLDVGNDAYIYSISVWKREQLYFGHSDVGKSSLKCIGLDGTVTSISAEDINEVINVKTDRLGNAYLLQCTAANFSLFSFEDKSIKTILTKNDGLNNLYGFAFSTDFSKLFISNYYPSEILVFVCK